MSITQTQLEKMIHEIFFSKVEENAGMVLATGRGGMKETLKYVCDELGMEYNWINMRKAYRFLSRNNGVEKVGSSYILRA